MTSKKTDNQKSTFGLNANVVSMITYLIPLAYLVIASFITMPSIIGYILVFSPFIFYFFEKKSDLVRFHATQSIVLNVALPILFEIIVLLSNSLGLLSNQTVNFVISLLYLLVILSIVILSTYSCIKARSFQTTNIFIISKIAKFFA